MNTVHLDWQGTHIASMNEQFSNSGNILSFLYNARNKFDLSKSTYEAATAPFVHIYSLEIIKNYCKPKSSGVYLGCSIPLGLLIFQKEGYNMAGIDIDRKAMNFGKRQGMICIKGDACKLKKHFPERSLDFTVSRNFKRRDYLSDPQIVKILGQEYDAIKQGGIAVSSTHVADSYLKENMEELYIKTPFRDITRYIVQITHISKKGEPAAVIDVLRKT